MLGGKQLIRSQSFSPQQQDEEDKLKSPLTLKTKTAAFEVGSPQVVRLATSNGQEDDLLDLAMEQLQKEKEELEDSLQEMQLSNHAMENTVARQATRIGELEQQNNEHRKQGPNVQTSTTAALPQEVECKLQDQVKELQLKVEMMTHERQVVLQEREEQQQRLAKMEQELARLKQKEETTQISDDQIKALRMAKQFFKLTKEQAELNETADPHFKKRAEWQLDQDASQCMQCKAKFGPLFRRHHCRVCGKVFCGNCSSTTHKGLTGHGSKATSPRDNRTCKGCNDNISQARKKYSTTYQKKKEVEATMMKVFEQESVVDSETDEDHSGDVSLEDEPEAET